MIINTQDYPVSDLSRIAFKPQVVNQDINTKDVFNSVLNAALSAVNETNRLQHAADALQLDLAAGRTDNILSVLMAQEKAYSSLNFTVQATNKIIESYREIMRMQL